MTTEGNEMNDQKEFLATEPSSCTQGETIC